MSDSKNTSSSVGSAIGGALSSMLQIRLMNDPAFISSTKAMLVSQLRLCANVIDYNIRMSREQNGASSQYDKVVLFEGHRITPAARDTLLQRCLNMTDYDELNHFTARLAWWLFEKDPYKNTNLEAPLPEQRPTNKRPHASTAFHIGLVMACLVSIVAGKIYSVWIVPIMFAVLFVTYVQSRPVRKPAEEPEWAWLSAYS